LYYEQLYYLSVSQIGKAALSQILHGNFRPPYWYPDNYAENLTASKRASG